MTPSVMPGVVERVNPCLRPLNATGFYFSVPIFSALIGFSRWSYRVLASSPENVLFVLGVGGMG